MLHGVHTTGTADNYVDFAQISIFFLSATHICGSKNVHHGCTINEKTLFSEVNSISKKSVILLFPYMLNSSLAKMSKM